MFELRASRVISYRNDLLSGLTVALALVPEAVAFAFVAGVDPLVGLYAAFMVGLITACIGGRPGMISGATGALAVVMVSLVADHGVQYLFMTVVLMGFLQILAGVFKLGKFIRMVPHPVMLLLVAMDGGSKRAGTQFKRHARIPRHPARTAHKARGHTNRKAETTTAGTRATTQKEAATETDLGTPQVNPREQPLPAEAQQINSFQPRPIPAA